MATPNYTTSSICFIGGGNMATSLISGLLSAGRKPECISVIDPDGQKRKTLNSDYGIQAFASMDQAPTSDIWVLAVKPQVMANVCAQIKADAEHQPLIISIAAGVPIAALQKWLGADQAYIRCMPNTPALVGLGATGLFAPESINKDQRQAAESILSCAGKTAWVESEALLDAVTATSGSGPAYYFAFMEAMIESAQKLGLSEQSAKELVLQTALGAATLALKSDDSPATLRQKVTSPGGTTEQALNSFSSGGLQSLVDEAMRAAAQRADQLAQDLLNNS